MVARIWLLIVLCIGVRGKKYHTSDPVLLASKKQLLASATDIGSPGGIRARLGPELINITATEPLLKELKKGSKALAEGQNYVAPLFDGVAAQYLPLKAKLNLVLDKLDSAKDKTDKAISNFAYDWASVVQKRMHDDPGAIDNVFTFYNQFVLQMHALLSRVSQMVERQLLNRGATLYRGNLAVVQAQNATLVAEERALVTAKLLFSRMLNGNALPTIATARMNTAGNFARVKQGMAESLDDLKSNILVTLADSGSQYLDTGADKLLLDTQKQVVAFTTSVAKSLVTLRSQLGQMAMKDSTGVSRNLTSIDTLRDSGTREIEKQRIADKAKIVSLINEGLATIESFKTGVMDSMGDVGQMLGEGDTELTAATTRAKLINEKIDAETSAAVAALFSPAIQGAGGVHGLDAMQGQISNLFNSQTGTAASALSGDVKQRAAMALSDAEDALAGSSSLFGSVATDGGSELEGKIGVSTAQLQGLQSTAVRRVGDAATDVQLALDSAAADNEDEQAGIVNKFIHSATSKDAVLTSMSGLADQIAARQDVARIAQQVAGGDVLAGLATSRSSISAQDGSVDAMEKRLAQVSAHAVPQLDAQNEARIRDAFGQLNSLRRLSAANGDLLETSGGQQVSKLISQTMIPSGVSIGNVSSLGVAVADVQAAGTAYASQANQFEAEMNRQMNSIASSFASVQNGTDSAMNQIVTQSNMAFTNAGRFLVRSLYNTSSSLGRWIGSNPKFNVGNYLGYLLNDTATFQLGVKTEQTQLVDLAAKNAGTTNGINQYLKYLADMKKEIANKYFFNLTEEDKVGKLVAFKRNIESELQEERAALNASIGKQFETVNEAIGNKTSNFYKQFQTASIVADSVVQGFADYVAKIIAVENMTATQRTAMEAKLIGSIQLGINAMPKNITSANDIDKVNALVRIAMNASDTSAAGMARRAEANQALLAMVGTQAAEAMKDKYTKLAANAGALSSAIEASQADLVADRVGSLAGSQMGVEGINAASQLFSNQAGSVLADQKANAQSLGSKIDQLLSGSSFLTNISASEFGEILKSIQKSDNLHNSQQSAYQEASGSQVATLGGVVQNFAQLVTLAVNETTDYLNKMSANYTDLVVRTDAVITKPVNAVKQDVVNYGTVAENVKAALDTQLLSITPIEDGLSERIASMLKQQDDFAEGTQKQLAEFVANVHQMQGDISTSREAGMRKLHTAIASLLDRFRTTALQMQSDSVDKLSSKR